jgi:hypothetical protein
MLARTQPYAQMTPDQALGFSRGGGRLEIPADLAPNFIRLSDSTRDLLCVLMKDCFEEPKGRIAFRDITTRLRAWQPHEGDAPIPAAERSLLPSKALTPSTDEYSELEPMSESIGSVESPDEEMRRRARISVGAEDLAALLGKGVFLLLCDHLFFLHTRIERAKQLTFLHSERGCSV